MPRILLLFVLTGPLIILGYIDVFQTRHTVRRNFPLLGRLRYFFEMIRPEINQYFIESNTNGVPLSREQRSLVYQRSKKQLDTLPFGTQMNVYEPGYEWLEHSIMATKVDPKSLRVRVGGPQATKTYNASILNISAMSYGALSKNAVLALNGGAKDGGFAHNTGEGGLSPYHLQPGGDLIWQVGTGYFGCRTPDGNFSEELFREKANLPQVKMIELKISQGAKPGHGGILPAIKLTPEIAQIRHLPLGQDVISPPSHKSFHTPTEMMQFIKRLRELAEGRPVGFKLCVGSRREFLAICKAIEKTGILPDYISIDGGEGGTGAAPLEFSNHVGCPTYEALVFANNCLKGFSLRKDIRLFSSGKMTSAFQMIKLMALGADVVYSARGMMLSLGCIQALRCNANTCPTGITSQNPQLIRGLNVQDKRKRVATFHGETIRAVADILGAMGLNSTDQLHPSQIHRRIDNWQVKTYAELYEILSEGCLKQEKPPPSFEKDFFNSNAKSFHASL